MRVLVTGGSGFLGHAVVASLRRHGHDTLVMQRTAGDRESVQGDVRDRDAVRRAVADVDGVCHLAGLARVRESFTRPVDYWATNVGGTINLLDALVATAEDAPKRLVLASTAAVYGTPEKQPIDEDTATAPNSPYGASKLAADQAAADASRLDLIGAVSLRAFNIAGDSCGRPDSDRTRLIPKVLAVQAGLEPDMSVNGNGSAVRDFVHVFDMADAFALALAAATPGSWRAYNIGAAQASVSDVIRAAEEVTGRPVPVRHLPPANEPLTLVADSTRARDELGWQPKKSTLPQILQDAWNALTS